MKCLKCDKLLDCVMFAAAMQESGAELTEEVADSICETMQRSLRKTWNNRKG